MDDWSFARQYAARRLFVPCAAKRLRTPLMKASKKTSPPSSSPDSNLGAAQRRARPTGRPVSGQGGPAPAARMLLAAAALVVMALAAYWPVLSANYIWDDDFHVTNNRQLRTAEGLENIWLHPRSIPQYYPLVHTTFWIEYHLWQAHPLGYHLVNVLLHATNGILLWQLLRRLRVPGAWLAAAIFVVHPVAVESVAWVTERKNVLSLAMALSSILCYLRFQPPDSTEHPAPRDRQAWLFYALALAFFVGALFSKTVVATLPAVLLVIYWWQRGRLSLDLVWPLVPFFALGIGLGLFTVRMETEHVGAVGPEFDLEPAQRLLIAGRAVWFYASKLAWPYPLVFFYPRWQVQSGVWWQWLFPLAAVALIGALWMARGKVGRGPLAAALIFGGVLMPALGFFNVYPFRYSYVADHFQYHASMALIVLAAAAMAVAAERLGPSRRGQCYAAAVALCAALALLTNRQAREYHDEETLYSSILEQNPQSWNSYLNLGVYYKQAGRRDEAYAMLEKAAELNSTDPTIPYNLGHILVQSPAATAPNSPQLAEGIQYLRHALAQNPRFAEAHNALGFALLKANRPQEARSEFDRVLEIDATHAEAIYGQGVVKTLAGDWAGAQPYFEHALELYPEYVDAQQALALSLMNQNRLPEAADYLERLANRDRSSVAVLYQLGNVRGAQRDWAAAAQAYARAVKLQPDFVDAWLRLGAVELQSGQLDQAVAHLREAVRLAPNHPQARAELDRAIREQGARGK